MFNCIYCLESGIPKPCQVMIPPEIILMFRYPAFKREVPTPFELFPVLQINITGSSLGCLRIPSWCSTFSEGIFKDPAICPVENQTCTLKECKEYIR